jgi:hypothetical protein
MHEPPPLPDLLPSGNEPGRMEEVRNLGWNWAGFLLPCFWLLGHGRVGAGFVLLLALGVPFLWPLFLVGIPGLALYLGLRGYEIAWRHQPLHSVEQLVDRERAWVLWGLVWNVLLWGGALLVILYGTAVVEDALWEVSYL